MRRSGTIEIDGAVVEAHHLWYVREELRLYPERKRHLAELQTTIVTETAVNETPGIQSGTTSNPTMGRAMALMTSQQVAWLAPRIEWIERVWANLHPVTQKVLNMLVIKETHQAAGAAMVIQEIPGYEKFSEASVYRELNRGLLALAIDLWGMEIILNGKAPKRRARKKSSKTVELESFAGV